MTAREDHAADEEIERRMNASMRKALNTPLANQGIDRQDGACTNQSESREIRARRKAPKIALIFGAVAIEPGEPEFPVY